MVTFELQSLVFLCWSRVVRVLTVERTSHVELTTLGNAVLVTYETVRILFSWRILTTIRPLLLNSTWKIARSKGSFIDKNGCRLLPPPAPHWNALATCRLCHMIRTCHHVPLSKSRRLWLIRLQVAIFWNYSNFIVSFLDPWFLVRVDCIPFSMTSLYHTNDSTDFKLCMLTSNCLYFMKMLVSFWYDR